MKKDSNEQYFPNDEEWFWSLIEEKIGEEYDLEEMEEDELAEKVQNLSSKALLEAVTPLYQGLKKTFNDRIKEWEKDKEGFETRLYERWKEPLDLLRALIHMHIEIGHGIAEDLNEGRIEEGWLIQALLHLHAQACHISFEIHSLLRSGHADGANARWRSLHETSVIMNFLSKHGEKTAERFLKFKAVEDYKHALSQRKHADRLNIDGFSEEEIKQLKRARDDLVDEYGEKFKERYGWAAHIYSNRGERHLKKMEEDVGLDYLRPYYKLASSNVHSDAKGALFKLGNFKPDELLLAGPSDYGLAEPGQLTAISLQQATSNFVNIAPNVNRILGIEVGNRWVEETIEAFHKAHKKVEQSQDDIQP